MNTILETPATPRSSGILQATRKIGYSAVFAGLLLLQGLMIPARLTAQGITGSVTGTVTDSSGAVIADATVTVRQIETNSIKTITTSSAGTYTITQLQPGHYSVKVEKTGFKSNTQTGITLTIDQTVQIDAQLTVGSQQESVEVTSTGPVIQTEDSSVGQLIDSQAIQNTPLNGRLSVMGLIALAPGMQNSGAQDQMATRGLTVAAGTGSRNSYGGLGISFDGVINKEVTLQRGEPEIPSLDALSQFKVLSTGAPAEFNEPTQIIVVSSSGTNAFHGELFEFNRSKGTSAKSYFNGSTVRPPYERNEYGGNFSGPIIVPHLYDGRDKSFFFFAYEGFSYTYSSSANTFQPTDKMRSGDFSDFLFGGTCYTGKAMNLVNPVTKVNYTTTNGNKIPTADQNTTSLALLNLLYPHATNQNVCSSTNTYETIGYSQAAKRFSARLDHKLSEHDQLRATFMHAFYGPYAASWTDSLAGGYGGIGEHDKYAAFRVPEVPLPSCLTPTFGALSCNPSGKFCIACA